MISRTRTVNVAEALSPNLALRETAVRFIQYVEGLPEPEITLDFNDVRTITRSFAHEYCSRKRHMQKHVRETNVSLDIAKMFAVVNESRGRRPSHVRIDFDGIPVTNF